MTSQSADSKPSMFFFNTEVFPVRALPSSGIIPLLQQFCNNKDKDEHGFPVHPNARYLPWSEMSPFICRNGPFVQRVYEKSPK